MLYFQKNRNKFHILREAKVEKFIDFTIDTFINLLFESFFSSSKLVEKKRYVSLYIRNRFLCVLLIIFLYT